MSARRNRRAKKRKKTQEDKIKRAKALLQPHPGKCLVLDIYDVIMTNMMSIKEKTIDDGINVKNSTHV